MYDERGELLLLLLWLVVVVAVVVVLRATGMRVRFENITLVDTSNGSRGGFS